MSDDDEIFVVEGSDWVRFDARDVAKHIEWQDVPSVRAYRRNGEELELSVRVVHPGYPISHKEVFIAGTKADSRMPIVEVIRASLEAAGVSGDSLTTDGAVLAHVLRQK